MASIFDGIDEAAAEVLMMVMAEPVTYYPAAGGSRSIEAIVERNAVGEVSGGNTPMGRMMVRNSATIGISSAEFDRGGDQIGYPVNLGESASSRPVKQMPSQTTGMIILEAL